MSANDKQIGGSHYKSKSECWDYIIDNNLGYLEGTAIKYLTRWRKKNGRIPLGLHWRANWSA